VKALTGICEWPLQRTECPRQITCYLCQPGCGGAAGLARWKPSLAMVSVTGLVIANYHVSLTRCDKGNGLFVMEIQVLRAHDSIKLGGS